MAGIFISIDKLEASVIVIFIMQNMIFVFPGQGSQYAGMGAVLYDAFPAVRYTFQEVSDLSHNDLAAICFDVAGAGLHDVDRVSLAVFTHSVSIARVIEAEFNMPLYKIGYALAGHSVGQCAALYCADSINMSDAVSMLAARSKYMSSVNFGPGGMASIVGCDRPQVDAILADARKFGFVEISNHNARNIFIISGHNAALDFAMRRAYDAGARLVRRLDVAVPAHCALMADAEKSFRKYLENVNIAPPKTNLFSNQTGDLISEPQKIKSALSDQITHGVRWVDIMERFPAHGITQAYELGPGRVLTGLINRAKVGCTAYKTDDVKAVKEMLAMIDRNIVNRQISR